MKIGVIGSMNLDKVAKVDHIPLKGETLLAESYMETYGGKGANQAVSVAKFGGDVTMFGCVGDDSDGARTIDHMIQEGVNMDPVETIINAPTGRAFICVGEEDNTIVVISGANSYVTREYLERKQQRIEEMDIRLLQNEIPMPSIEWILEKLGDRKQVIYNPAPYREVDMNLLKKATWITPNESEAANLLDHEEGPEIQPKCILTRGSKGIAFMEDGHVIRVHAIKCSPVDTTGAGDTFNGALAYGLSQEWTLTKSVKFANVAGGMSTEKEGAQKGMPSLEEVNKRSQ